MYTSNSVLLHRARASMMPRLVCPSASALIVVSVGRRQRQKHSYRRHRQPYCRSACTSAIVLRLRIVFVVCATPAVPVSPFARIQARFARLVVRPAVYSQHRPALVRGTVSVHAKTQKRPQRWPAASYWRT